MSKRSRRYGSDPHDAVPEEVTNPYQRRKSSLERQHAEEKAKAAQAETHAAEIEKLKAKDAAEFERQPRRKGGPMPGDFHWGFYPDEE